MIRPPQIKAARALLGISQLELSKKAGVAVSTVKRIELGEDMTGSARTLWKLQTCLEKAGVEFIPGEEHRGPGVRLKEGSRTRPKRGGRSRA